MLIVVRHGRTATNARGALLGRSDPSLDELGETQAAAVRRALGPVDRIVSSPLLRCRQTAAAIGGAVEIDDRLIELDYGEWDGLPIADLPSRVWADWRNDPDLRPPGGETLTELGSRVGTALEDLRADAQHRDVVVVTHVSPIKATLAWTLGVGIEVSWRAFVAPASITRIAVGEHGPSLHSFNEVAHLTV